MIFVTVGGQVPFDRLVRTVDAWAEKSGRRDVFAQIGPGRFEPRMLRWTRFLAPAEFRQAVKDAEVVVSHAGMGTILTALDAGTPILVMPRRQHLGETRNDHQVATMRHVEERWKIAGAEDEAALLGRLERLAELRVPQVMRAEESPGLLQAIRRFVENA